MSGATVEVTAPILHGDYGLIQVQERIQWREALPRYLLANMSQANGQPLSQWKIEEQVQPVMATVYEFFNKDPLATLQALEEYFSPASLAHRSDYAS